MPDAPDARPPSLLRSIGRDRIAIALLVLALAVRLAVWAEFRAWDLDLSHAPLDMRNFVENGRRVAQGDLLLVEQDLGTLAALRDDYYGRARFDRLFGRFTYVGAPLYDYFVGACFASSGTESPYVVSFAQVLLGVATCALVYGLALRRGGLLVARLALLLAALLGELVIYEAFLLRETLAAFAVTWALHDLARAQDEGGATWARAGFAWAVSWLSRTSVVLLLPAVAIALLDPRRETERGRRAIAAGALAFVLGAAVPLVPLAARNLALGVPPLRFCVGRQVSAILGNHPRAPLAGSSNDHATVHEIMERRDVVTPLDALVAAVREHPGPGSWLALLAAKAQHWLAPVDFGDNVRLDFLLPVLRSSWLAPLRWGHLAPLLVVGACLLARSVAAARENAILLVGVGWTLATVLLASVLTRYKLDGMPLVAVVAAGALATGVEAARARRWSRVLILVLAAGAVATIGRTARYRPRPATRAEAAHYFRLVYELKGERGRVPLEYALDRLSRSSLP